MYPSINAPILGAILVSLTLLTAQAQADGYAGYKWDSKGNLSLFFNSGPIAGHLDQELEKIGRGYVVNSDSKTAYIKNFRTRFGQHSIKIRFDYDAKTRGWSWVGPKKAYLPWVKDSGWIEGEFQVFISDWRIYCSVRNVEWRSNNWFTRDFTSLLPFHKLALKWNLENNLRDAIESQIGMIPDLRQIAVNEGAKALSKELGLPYDVASQKLENQLNNSALNVYFSNKHVILVVNMNVPTFASGTLLKAPNSNYVYMILEGRRHHVRNEDALYHVFHNYAELLKVEKNLQSIPEGPPLTSLSLLKGNQNPEVFLVNEYGKFWVPHEYAFLNWSGLRIVNEGILNEIRYGGPAFKSK